MTRTLAAMLSLSLALIAAPALTVVGAVTTFDANASEWSSLTAPVLGVVIPIGGTGQVNGNFVIVDDPAVGSQIGLRAIERFSPTPLVNTAGDYIADAGESTPGVSTWNYDIHIDLRGTGLSFDDYTISFLSNVSNHSAIDLQTALEFGGALPPGSLGAVELFQVSTNPTFFASGVDPFAAGVYTFDLTLTPKSGVTADTLAASITVTVVPEPTTVLLIGFGMAAATLVTRRR